MTERGEIRNRECARQIKDFRGLRFRNITPTDIDGFLDFGDKVFIFMELKFNQARLSEGQRLACERLVDRIGDAGKQSYLLLARHKNEIESDINVAECEVVRYRYKQKWIIPSSATTIRGAIETILKFHHLESYIT